MNPDKLVIDYYPLVRSVAKKYTNLGVPLEDLEQEGMIGLLEAAKNFDDNKGAKFSTYATYWIKKKIIQSLDNETKSSLQSLELDDRVIASNHETETEATKDDFKLPDGLQELEKKVLTLHFKKEFTLKEIAEELNISREKARQIKEKGLRRLRAIMGDELYSELNLL